MSEIIKSPQSFQVGGNLLNEELAAPSSTTPFSVTKGALALEDPIIINGVSVIPLKVTANFS